MKHENISIPIKITCEAMESLPIAEMSDFQGELKTRTDEDYEKIFASIRKYGIAFPFFVWKSENNNFVLDGHGRLESLRRAMRTGYIVPELPVIYIDAADETVAKNLLLRLNSRYGAITLDGVKDFINGANIDLNGINIPELPNLSASLDALLNGLPMPEETAESDVPKFNLYCPECGEAYETTDEELRGLIEYED